MQTSLDSTSNIQVSTTSDWSSNQTLNLWEFSQQTSKQLQRSEAGFTVAASMGPEAERNLYINLFYKGKQGDGEESFSLPWFQHRVICFCTSISLFSIKWVLNEQYQ